MTTPAAWRPTPALRRGVTVLAVALLAAAGLGRPDLLVLASVFAVGLVSALAVRPRAVPRAELVLPADRVAENAEFTADVRVTNPDPAPVVGIVTAATGDWLRLRHGAGHYVDALPGGHSTAVSLAGATRNWGRHAIGPARVHAVACDGLLRSPVLWLPERTVLVHPTADRFDSRRGLPRAAGMTGIHRSRRGGDGGELAEVRPFQPGDRLRRIDWRVSLRQREPFVNATLSERDAEIVVLVDVLHEAANADGDSILDITVRAAAALTEHYVHQGDRVSIVEFGPGMRRLRPGTGRRQFLAALEWLTDTAVASNEGIAADRLVSGGYLPFGSVVIMLTPLIDQRSTEALARLIRSGRTVMTVDTMPPDLAPPYRGPWTATATRLWFAERDHTVARLRRLGVPVAAWHGPGSLDLMLTDLARLERVPRRGAR